MIAITANARVVDLCCGMGGLSVAAREMGMTVVGGVDLNPSALRTEAGYHVEKKVLDSSEYGVPQKRKRAFFFCHPPFSGSWPDS